MKKNICFFCLFFLPLFLFSQLPADTTRSTDSTFSSDSTFTQKPVLSPPTPVEMYNEAMERVFGDNVLLNSKGVPAAVSIKERKREGTEILFYFLLMATLLLAFLRFFYTRYFNNLFQVFFNTSLRQSQLTDQLLQAKLASAFFNLFFVITGGIYIAALLRYYNIGLHINLLLLIITCILIVAAIYFVKFCVLKFTGWLTGFKEVANTYLFVIFLISKIIGVLLLPFAIAIVFSVSGIRLSAVVVSVLMVSFMFFLRFVRSFGLLRSKIKVSWFHFLIFIAGIEILPLLLIYKGVVILLPKNL